MHKPIYSWGDLRMPNSLRTEPGLEGSLSCKGADTFLGTVVLMAPCIELNAGGPWFCHLAFPICLNMENKTSPRTILGYSTSFASELQMRGKS